jgi:GntR family transcriptional repressor for pyruvate dehydrogenase complex
MRSSLKAVEKKRAYEDIVQQVVTLIEGGKLKRGDQLPSERELTEAFKVSRTTVREAIRTLESMQLLQCLQGNGTYILASSEEALIRPLAAALFDNDKDNIRDLFYVRKVIEPHIAQLAAENATPQEIQKIEGILRRHRECIEHGKSYAETNSLFHRSVARASKNSVIERLFLAMIDLLRRSPETDLSAGDPLRRAMISLEGHQRVISAIKSGDADAAKESMLQHIEDMEKIVFGK